MLDFSSQRDYGVSSQAWEIHTNHITYHCSTSKELPKGIQGTKALDKMPLLIPYEVGLSHSHPFSSAQHARAMCKHKTLFF